MVTTISDKSAEYVFHHFQKHLQNFNSSRYQHASLCERHVITLPNDNLQRHQVVTTAPPIGHNLKCQIFEPQQ